jgi:hypothetical protein
VQDPVTPEEDIFASPTSATAARSLTASFGSSDARAPTTSVASTDVPENVVADVVHEPMDKQDTRILVCQENIDKQELKKSTISRSCSPTVKTQPVKT